MPEYKIGKSRHKLLCRWWLKTKTCCNSDIIEFYVPWYAWPIELFHRLIFGYHKLEK